MFYGDSVFFAFDVSVTVYSIRLSSCTVGSNVLIILLDVIQHLLCDVACNPWCKAKSFPFNSILKHEHIAKSFHVINPSYPLIYPRPLSSSITDTPSLWIISFITKYCWVSYALTPFFTTFLHLCVFYYVCIFVLRAQFDFLQ